MKRCRNGSVFFHPHTLQVDTAEDEERVERVQELCSALLLSDEQLQHIGRGI